jgi:hypothetical protein
MTNVTNRKGKRKNNQQLKKSMKASSKDSNLCCQREATRGGDQSAGGAVIQISVKTGKRAHQSRQESTPETGVGNECSVSALT